MKSVHEELALQWVVATSTVRRDAAANNSRLTVQNYYTLFSNLNKYFFFLDFFLML